MKKFTTILLCLSILSLTGCAGEKAEEEHTKGLENGEFTASLNGFDIFYAVHGQGPICMVLPNSWGLSHGALRVLYRPLEEHLTMVYFDPRGMGRSGDVVEDSDMSMAAVRDDLDALRQHLGLGKVNVIGWSNGAMNLLVFASERPEAVESAIVVHGAASISEEDMKLFQEKAPELWAEWGKFMGEMTSDLLSDEEKEEKYREFSRTRSFPAMLADRERDGAKLEEFFDAAELSWKHSKYSDQVDSPTFDARDLLGKITAPTLVIAGVHDLMPVEKGVEIAEGISNAKLVIFEESGHFAQFEEQEKFVKTILQFIGVEN
jgi:proline iminopeptidase